jgi:hypothetical protein
MTIRLKSIFLLTAGFWLVSVYTFSQAFVRNYTFFFDSIDNRISSLQQQIPLLKQSRDVSYYNLQRELDFAIFTKEYETLIMNEDLEGAKNLAGESLLKAEAKKDRYAGDYYSKYLDKANYQLKLRLQYYQELLSGESKFMRTYNEMTGPGTADSYLKARHLTEMAIKYALEYKNVDATSFLNRYLNKTDAVLYDLNTDYDLRKITGDKKRFSSVFVPMIGSDSINIINEAGNLLAMCRYFSGLILTDLDSAFLHQQSILLANALSDVLAREGKEKDIEKYTSKAIKARSDTLNPTGVFKWNDYIVVIDEFSPRSGFTNVRNGEAVIQADMMLSTFLVKNRLCRDDQNLSFGYTYVIPYSSKDGPFIFNQLTGKWQYMVCYTVVIDDEFTEKAARLMPPMLFAPEFEMVQN